MKNSEIKTIDIITSNPNNTISIINDTTVVQIVRFQSGNFSKQVKKCKTSKRARQNASYLVKYPFSTI